MLSQEILDIKNRYEILNLTPESEDEKLRLIQSIYESIFTKFNPNLEEDTENQDYDYCSSFNYIFYNSLLITSLIKHALSSFLFSMTLLELIPGISHLTTIIISIIYTLLDSIIFYAIEISYLKRALSIPDDTDAISVLIETYIFQLKLVKAINQELASGNAMSFEEDEYQAYLNCVTVFNQDISHKFSSINDYQDSNLKCIIKNIIILIGVISKMAGSYFIAKSLLTTLAAFLIGTPLGGVFIATIIFGGVGFFYALGEHSVTKLINPEMEAFKKLKINFQSFEQDLPKHQNASRHIQNFFHRSLIDREIQVNESMLCY